MLLLCAAGVNTCECEYVTATSFIYYNIMSGHVDIVVSTCNPILVYTMSVKLERRYSMMSIYLYYLLSISLLILYIQYHHHYSETNILFISFMSYIIAQWVKTICVTRPILLATAILSYMTQIVSKVYR